MKSVYAFFKIFTLFPVFLFSVFYAWGQTNIGGVINTYTSVTAISPCNPCSPSCNKVTVSSLTGTGAAGGFNAGDRVVIIQMKGSSIDLSNSSVFGSVASFGGAGYFEKLQIASIAGSDITFSSSLINTYDVTGAVQLVKYSVYANANVTSALTALPWNGTVGGVLVLEVTGSLILNANIDVSGQGFLGGVSASNGFSYPCGLTDYYYPFTGDYGNAAGKGEGITILPAGYELGRGAAANGGGGGNSHNGGGGGGSNAGVGGLGGKEYTGCGGTSSASGIGGKSITGYTGIRAFAGGGGGAGHQNNNVGTNGANGGGIISISASQITGNGFSILANGADALNTTSQGNDGAGGGGGGGSILLSVSTYSGILNISANGGKGGDMIETVCHATGGGGGGGRICYSSASLPAGVSATVVGGAPGNASSSCATSSGDPYYGATFGQAGTINASCVTVPPSGIKTIEANLGGDAKLCNPVSLTLDSRVTGPWYTYAWYKDDVLLPAETAETLFIAAPGEYKVTVSSPGCNPGRDSINITTDAAVPQDSLFCAPPAQPVQLKVMGAGKYKWWTQAVGGVAVGTGPAFTTAPISADTTFYVEDTATFSRGDFTPVSMLTSFNTRTGASNTYMGFNALTPIRIDSVTAFIRTYNTNNDIMVVNLRQRGNPTPLATRSLLVTGPCNCTTDQPVQFYLGFDVPAGNEYYLEYASGSVNVHWDGSGAIYPYTSPGVISIYGPVDGSGAPIGWAPTSYGFFYDWIISAGTLCERVPVRAILSCSLPVEWLDFNAIKVQGGVQLHWSTASEKENLLFIVERSYDGVHFDSIGMVSGSGTIMYTSNYSFDDNHAPDQTLYYRLLQKDVDYHYSYSKIIRFDHLSDDTKIIAYPNPFKDNILIKGVGLTNFVIKLYNSTGQKILEKEAVSEVRLGEELSPGVYIAEVISDSREIVRLIKIDD